MLNFDRDRFVAIQGGAVALAPALDRMVTSSLASGAQNLIFAGAGGAGILMWPAARLLQSRSSFPVHVEMPAELVLTGSAHLGPRSLVVLPSLSGTTDETVDALEYCKARGATVVALTGHAGTPLAERADHAFVNPAADDTSCESFYVQSLVIALSLMHHRGEIDDYATLIGELQRLPELLVGVKEQVEERAEQLADAIAQEPFHIITGAGSTWPQAFYYGMCILEEMQWIRTRPVHASDFFHGTLELLDDGQSILVLRGEDASRPLVDRVLRFAPRYTDKVELMDSADFPLPGISTRLRAMLSPVLLATALERVSAHLEVKRDHPLTTRRYYKRVPY